MSAFYVWSAITAVVDLLLAASVCRIGQYNLE